MRDFYRNLRRSNTIKKARPNILFIVFDQMRADALIGPLADTIELPNFTQFKNESVSFLNHFSVTSPCGPARASLLTGQYAMNHRSVRNGTPLAHDTSNLATSLNSIGIEPLLYGYTDTSQDPRMYGKSDPILTSYEEVLNGFTEVQEMRFDTNKSWKDYLREKNYKFDKLSEIFEPIDKKVNAPAQYSAEDSDTAFLTDCLLNDLLKRKHGWCAHVTYVRPHPPFVAPAPYNSLISPNEMQSAHTLDISGKHPFDDIAKQFRLAKDMVIGFSNLKECPETTSEIRAVYMGLVAELDTHLGRIFQWLKETKQYDETLIIITSDHGEMLGDYGCWGKMHYFDGAFHVPLMIKPPKSFNGDFGTAIDAPSESIDVTPTILDLMGIEIPDEMDGSSLKPFLLGKKPEDWKKVTMSEVDFGDPVKPTIWQSQLGLSSHECNFSVLRSGRHRIVNFASKLPQILFEIKEDGDVNFLNDNKKYQETKLNMVSELLSHRMRNAGGRFSRIMITENGPIRGHH